MHIALHCCEYVYQVVDELDERKLTLVNLYRIFEAGSHDFIKALVGNSVVKVMFYSNFIVAAAKDHLITGIIKDLYI